MLPLAIAATSHNLSSQRFENPAMDAIALAQATAQMLPASFKSAKSPIHESALMTLPDNKMARLAFRLYDETIPTAQIAPLPSKIASRAQQAPDIESSHPAKFARRQTGRLNAPGDAMTSAGVDPKDGGAFTLVAGKTHNFRRAAAVGPTRIKADGMTIDLAGISPPESAATCKRIDGLVQPCSERAQHRLAILLQARDISCTIINSADRIAITARCKAGNIDLASDLLRHGLAQRTASRKLASVN